MHINANILERGRVSRGLLFVLDRPDEANKSVTQPVLKVSHLASQ